MAVALITVALPGCGPARNPDADAACVPPGDALVARALLDQANAALAHADAGTAVDALDAGLTKIGNPVMAGPAVVLDDTGQKLEGVRSTGDTRKLASIERRVLTRRLEDYGRYCGG